MKQSKGLNDDLAGTQENHKEHHITTTLRKHAYSNYIENFTTKKENIQIKNSDFFFQIHAQNINCGYSLVPTIYVFSKIRKLCIPL